MQRPERVQSDTPWATSGLGAGAPISFDSVTDNPRASFTDADAHISKASFFARVCVELRMNTCTAVRRKVFCTRLTLQLVVLWTPACRVLIKCDFGRLSSRFAEYCFQALRCADKTSCVFGFKRAEELIRIFISQLQNEIDTDWSVPPSKRGVPRGKAKTFFPEAEGAEAIGAIMDYYPDDKGIQLAIDKGLAKVQQLLTMDIGPITCGIPRPGSIWHYVTIPVRSVPYGAHRMRLLSTVSLAAGPTGLSTLPESELEVGGIEYGSEEVDEWTDERAEVQDTGAADSATDDDLAIGRGMIAAIPHDDGGEDAEEHDEPGGTLTKGKKRSVGRGKMTRLLAALLEFCRLVNAFISRQPRDPVNGRFWSTSEEFREALSMLTSADQDHLSDGDCVAVVEAEQGRAVVRVGFVERLLAPQQRHTKAKQALRRIRQLDINDISGRLRLRLLSPAGKDENGRLQYLMPHALACCANALWEARSIVQLVNMMPGRDDPAGGHYIMHEDDEKALRGYCAAHTLVLDEKGVSRGRGGAAAATAIVAGTVQAKGTDMAFSAPKPAQPRQRKLEMRVNPEARRDVAAALGQQTKSGRKVQLTKRALGED
ncbi:hypothetical protein VOLCADRAFT_106386 [Volvox carteri f. nagariensis]|uniref:Uncharacterized protein n=1 Tax=Volvox carteri f. nagariensis TaxID=3068 RepID=D8U732_VOLCA|nr:uncharacterized protein VOLCADRAFT_106386 [Volvox carteri f. nagariensis]EFJ44407.1 hypothetical protein VOLCADRAFT_106386 [Volvox carteri f. nagariensis]|eukprot:XP_002954514.1 hypothetical protein VOLCADRAFT_106386 [Volvox carteri f. nagariensis]